VKHPLARGECPGLAVVEIRKLSELQAAAMAAS